MVVVVTGNDQRRLLGKLGNALEHVLGRVAREVSDQLVVNRQVGREHEEVVNAMRQMQVGDKRPHQSGLAHARSECKTQRGKFALEVLQRRELRLQRGQDDGYVTPIVHQHFWCGIQRACQPPQRFLLRRPQRQAPGNVVLYAGTHACSPFFLFCNAFRLV